MMALTKILKVAPPMVLIISDKGMEQIQMTQLKLKGLKQDIKYETKYKK